MTNDELIEALQHQIDLMAPDAPNNLLFQEAIDSFKRTIDFVKKFRSI